MVARASLLIRPARGDDAAILAQFNCAMALETEHKQLHEPTVLAGVQGLLARPEFGFYLIAERGTEVVGSLMITSEWSDWRNGLFWWVQSVYVTPAHRRTGIYRQLYQEVKRLAAQRGDVCGFRLYCERDNHTAQKVYESLGMQRTDYLLYEEGGEV